jgi:hypothetical protein
VSRLFPERLRIALAPGEVSLARERGVLRKKLIQQKTLGCDAGFGAQPWHGALAALKQVDAAARATVILSNHFVRYAIIPWSDALGGPAEEEAYVRHHFAKIHGERAKSWALRWSETGGARLASAIDKALLEELKRSLPRLASVQPYLMAAINRWGKSIPRSGAWLALVEAERACIALHAGGRWRSVQNARGEWLALLDRERHRLDGEVPNLALVAGARADARTRGWKFQQLQGGLAH